MAEFARRLQEQSTCDGVAVDVARTPIGRAGGHGRTADADRGAAASRRSGLDSAIASAACGFLGAMDWRRVCRIAQFGRADLARLCRRANSAILTSARVMLAGSFRPCKDTRTFTAKWISPRATGIAMSSNGSPNAAGFPSGRWPRRRSSWRTQAADSKGVRERSAHVGYFLIDKGLPQLEAAAQARISLVEKLRRLAKRHPLLLYLGAIGSITLAVAAIAIFQAWSSGASLWLLVPMALLVLLGTTHLSVAIVNWLVDVVGDATAVAAHGFFRRDSQRVSHVGGQYPRC